MPWQFGPWGQISNERAFPINLKIWSDLIYVATLPPLRYICKFCDTANKFTSDQKINPRQCWTQNLAHNLSEVLILVIFWCKKYLGEKPRKDCVPGFVSKDTLDFSIRHIYVGGASKAFWRYEKRPITPLWFWRPMRFKSSAAFKIAPLRYGKFSQNIVIKCAVEVVFLEPFFY
jgi:hypothetical protein